jgi:cyclophilin family peptidyl-prolyl cis-trans isomerase
LIGRPSLGDLDVLGYAVFGKVVSGTDVVDNIVKLTTTVGSNQNVPVTDVLIQSATQNQ